MLFRPRVVSGVECNSKEPIFEVGSRADTTCMGGGTLKIYDFDCLVNVQGYDSALGVKQFQIISGVVGYTHPFTGRKYHLVIHQAIHMPNLDHHLLCPMQCRANGVHINECPRMYCSEPTDESHSIVAHDDDNERVIIPFFLRGVTSLFFAHLLLKLMSLSDMIAHALSLRQAS